jgi:hypothetical protein
LRRALRERGYAVIQTPLSAVVTGNGTGLTTANGGQVISPSNNLIGGR